MRLGDEGKKGEQGSRACEDAERMNQGAMAVGGLGHGLRVAAFRRRGVGITLRTARGVLDAADLELRKL